MSECNEPCCLHGEKRDNCSWCALPCCEWANCATDDDDEQIDDCDCICHVLEVE